MRNLFLSPLLHIILVIRGPGVSILLLLLLFRGDALLTGPSFTLCFLMAHQISLPELDTLGISRTRKDLLLGWRTMLSTLTMLVKAFSRPIFTGLVILLQVSARYPGEALMGNLTNVQIPELVMIIHPS